MYTDAKTAVRTPFGDSSEFPVRVGVHQGSSLSPFLFIAIIDELTKHIDGEAPWAMLFADDLALTTSTKAELEMKLEEWREALENAGIRVSRPKTEWVQLFTTGEDGAVKLGQEDLPEVKKFKYLGSTLSNDADTTTDVKIRINKGWQKWRSLTGVMCDKKIPLKVKGKVYRTVIRPVMMYGSETWAIKKTDEDAMDVAEMRMLRWSCGTTLLDKVRNEVTRDKFKVRRISEKVQEARPRWCGHLRF